MKTVLFSQLVHQRIDVSPFARRFPLLREPHYPAPAPTVLMPLLVIERDTFPQAEVVDTKTPEARLLASDVSNSEIKPVLVAQAKVLSHGGPPLMGYGKAAMAVVAERAAKGLRVKPDKLRQKEASRRDTQPDVLAHQCELAFDLFSRVPPEQAKTKEIAHAIAVAFDCSEGEVRERLPNWRKEFCGRTV
jgi:hypothetical protein